MHLCIDEREIVRPDRESHSAFLAGLEADTLEATQLHDRPRDRSDFLVHVELRDFIACTRTGICDVNRYFGCAASLDVTGLNAQVVKAKCRVAKTETKRVERLSGVERVGPVVRGLVVIEIRKVTYSRQPKRRKVTWQTKRRCARVPRCSRPVRPRAAVGLARRTSDTRKSLA